MPEKILVIDDEQNIRESTVALLNRKGYIASCVASGKEALDIVQKESFDILLLDVRMPGIDGIEVLRMVNELRPDIQVLMLTGHGTIDTAIEAMKYGAIGFLRKPVTIEDLQISIQDALIRGDTKRENTRLKALMPLFELNKKLLSELDEGKIIEIILNDISSEIKTDSIEVTIWSEDGNQIKKFAHNGSETAQPPQWPADDIIKTKVASEMKPLLLSRGEDKIYEIPAETSLIRSGYDIYIPLIIRDQAIGIIKTTKLPPHKPLRSSDIEFLLTLGGQSSIALSNSRLYENLEKAHGEVEELLKRVITNTEDERLRISLELHDGPIQSIIAAQFAVQACRASLNTNTTKIDEKLTNVGQTLLETTQNLRRIVSDLHPPDLEKSGLVYAIREYLNIIENEDKLKCYFKVKGKVVKLTYSTERGIYYIVRETITNIRKHAQASKIEVVIEFREDKMDITVQDDGIGFDPTKMNFNVMGNHVGLRSIHERARVLKSELIINSKPGSGTIIHLVLPIKKQIIDRNEEK
jgi:signal transduction histidine kinase/CheY-like chemotaxis protein